MSDDERTLTLQEYDAEISAECRPNYRRLRVRDWNRWECLHWLWHVGYSDCSYNYVDDAGLREEVLLQKAAMND